QLPQGHHLPARTVNGTDQLSITYAREPPDHLPTLFIPVVEANGTLPIGIAPFRLLPNRDQRTRCRTDVNELARQHALVARVDQATLACGLDLSEALVHITETRHTFRRLIV